jgi:hypothetical protein
MHARISPAEIEHIYVRVYIFMTAEHIYVRVYIFMTAAMQLSCPAWNIYIVSFQNQCRH